MAVAQAGQRIKMNLIAYNRNLCHIITQSRTMSYWEHFGLGAIDELHGLPWPSTPTYGYSNGRQRVRLFENDQYP
jgi:hypothetical protein